MMYYWQRLLKGRHHHYLYVIVLLLSIGNIFKSSNYELIGSYFDDEQDSKAGTGREFSSDKDRLLSIKPRNFPTFLWGIPSVDTYDEMVRRQMLRQTYLSFYKHEGKTPNRICSLNDILQERVFLDACQIAYTFFIGANPRGPFELLFPDESFPITTNPPNRSRIRYEDDIVYLNIRENQEDGKMPTWFKYASMVVEEQKLPFDYIAKVDSDTLVFMPAFLEFVDVHMSDTTKLVHAGLPFFDYFCNPETRFHDHSCPLPLTGNLFMSGEVSIMSSALARMMTSRECNRSAFLRHEDVLLSNWAFDCAASTANSSVHVVPIRREQVLRGKGAVANWLPKLPHRFSYVLWAHSTEQSGGYYKSEKNYRQTWADFVKYWNATNPTRTVVSLKSPYNRENIGLY